LDLVFFKLSEKQLQQAKKLGVQEIVYCNSFSAGSKIPNSSKNFSTAHLVKKPNAKEVQRMKEKVDYIVALGGTLEQNRFAAVTRGADFLLSPCSSGKLQFDTAIGRICKEHGTKILVPISDFFKVKDFDRAMLFKNYLMTVKIASKFKIPVEIVSGAGNKMQIRSRDDLDAFGEMLGVKYPIRK